MSESTFLTIPDAPNYEINAELIVRDRTTKRELKPYLHDSLRVVKLFHHGHKITRSLKTLYCQALAAVDSTEWEPVPSLKGAYELSRTGALRNARTKHILSPNPSGATYTVYIKGKQRTVFIAALLNEVFGAQLPIPLRTVGVTLTKGGECHEFPTLAACAVFLESREYYCEEVFRTKLSQRLPEICGWAVKYREPVAAPAAVSSVAVGGLTGGL